MELPSPVASVVPSLVLNAVVTLGTGSVSQQRSRLREYPVCATWAVVLDYEEEIDGKKAQERQPGRASGFAGDASGCGRDRYRSDGDLRGHSTGSSPRECAFLSDLHAGFVRPGGMVEAMWCEDSGDGIHGGLLDSSIPDLGGSWF